ncbi:BTB/POZ and MATH domain-containing protein 2-like [Panicum miliaceum]|uniref:BTB/POZ and MATH domain-containing protein 2-like n=1 Tax=Panicum miliaceum TaxID=4540 RepID=A0A3L6SSQ3_PANMI|nr:BTB/POZ and MATH domain-containing protein 2-like [Panicum miliaceum]
MRIEDMEPAVFKMLLHFIYTDSPPGSFEGYNTATAQDLMVAADRYGMERLKSSNPHHPSSPGFHRACFTENTPCPHGNTTTSIAVLLPLLLYHDIRSIIIGLK